jgi:hypothetical protein
MTLVLCEVKYRGRGYAGNNRLELVRPRSRNRYGSGRSPGLRAFQSAHKFLNELA